MRVSVLQDKLARGLSIVGRAVENRPTLPVLGNILLATGDSRVKLAATNLEMSITTWIGAKIEQEGGITLPARTLADLVNNLSPERVDLALDVATQTVNVRCGATVSNIKGIDASEFPLIPEGGPEDVVLPGKVFKEMITQTVFAAAKEDNRPILTGILMQFDGNVMTMAAADGYRLAVRTLEIEQHFPQMREFVVPARALSEVGRIIGDEDETVSISLPGERDLVMFHMRYTDVATQLLDGKFPDFASIIPRHYVTATTMYTSDLLSACKRAEIFARDSAYSAKLMVKPAAGPGEPGAVRIIGMSAERGDNEGMIDAAVEGEELYISFNIRYLIDVLNVVSDERVVFESNGAANPGVVRPENRDDFVCVIMPMATGR
ncbi:MAG: DNA polymerase III subunit beta [Anaerolineaceae bacterium]|nr:DNA polymerase III subunit beta [Anaerolineaceae bacterium]